MRGFVGVIFGLLLCIGLSGCATILNGSTQKVFIDAPPGTTVRDSSGMAIPIVNNEYNEHYIQLKRNHDYVLRFRNNGQELQASLPRSIPADWIVVDLLLDIALIFVDLWTGDWYTFDDKRIHFAGDSSKNNIKDSYVESYDRFFPTGPDTPRKKIGGVFVFGAGAVFPVNGNPIFFNGYKIGLGYTILPQFDLIVNGTADFIIALSP